MRVVATMAADAGCRRIAVFFASRVAVGTRKGVVRAT